MSSAGVWAVQRSSTLGVNASLRQWASPAYRRMGSPPGFAAANARFGQPEINIGFIPPIATTQSLARLIGRPRAIRYLNDGRMIAAQEALDVASGPDFQEGVEAFLAKRLPRWR